MNTVLICGSDKGGETVNLLFSAIRAVHSGVLHIREDSVAVVPPKVKRPDFVVIDNPAIKNVYTSCGIALFCKQASRGIEIPPSFFAVVDSDSVGAVSLLRGKGIETVTCGLSQKDTFTFSSLENDHAVVSLQRSIKALDGSDIVPVEVPVAFSASHSEYPVLAAVAVLLLCSVPLPEDGLVLG